MHRPIYPNDGVLWTIENTKIRRSRTVVITLPSSIVYLTTRSNAFWYIIMWQDLPQGRQEEATWAPCADMCAGHVDRDPATECAGAVDAAATYAVTVRPCRVVRPQPSSGSTSAAAVYAPHPQLLRSCPPWRRREFVVDAAQTPVEWWQRL